MSGKALAAVKWTSFGLIGIGLLLAVRALPTDEWIELLREWVEGLGFWGPIAFGLVYVLATITLVPGSAITIAAGTLFGLGIGFIVVSVSSTVGATSAFVIGRYLARSRIESMAESNKKFGAIDDAASEGGWRVVALLRLSPAVPFSLQNYLLGLTRISLPSYVLASWIAMMPGTLLYVYLGHVAGEAAGGGGNSLGQWILLGVGLVATVVVTVYLTKLAQKKLAERADDELESDDEPNDAEAPSTTKVFLLAGASVLVLTLGILAQVYSDSIAAILT